MSLVDRVRALLGDDAVDVAATPDGVPRVAPGSPDAVGLLLGTTREEGWRVRVEGAGTWLPADARSEEHTSELQSQSNLVCRLLLEKKKPDRYAAVVSGSAHATCLTPNEDR